MGILGIANLDGTPVHPEALEAMAAAAAHRGDLALQFAANRSVALGVQRHRAASDPAPPRSVLPFLVAADARLDGRKELEGLLEVQHGSAGGRTSDADLIRMAYARWACGCAERMIGDFAFALWDPGAGRLFCARDAMGMRPLYYVWRGGRFIFASEIKQILKAPGVDARLFEPAVAAYIADYSLLPGWTFYEGVSELPPGHALELSANGLRVFRHWDIDPEDRIRYPRVEMYIEHFREIFSVAVADRLRDGTPTGIMLSGGMDSGSVASMAGWLRREGKLPGAPPLHAFSDAYSSLVQCDERHISDEIVRQYSLPFSAIFIDESHSIWDPARHEPDQDAPIVSAFDPSLKLAFALAQTEGIQRMLTGHRGDLLIGSMIFDCLDPLFHGEWRFAAAELERLRLWYGISRTKAFQRHILAPLVQTLWPPYRLPGLRRRMSALYRRKANDFAYLPWIQPDFARRIGIERIIEQDRVPARLQPPSRAQRYKLIFIPHHMGMAAAIERLAARCGVELADVWADRRLARFCLAVPQNVINREAENKWLLRRAMKNVMPENARTAALKISPEPLFKKQLVDSKDYILNSLILNGICAQHGYVAANILAEAFLDYCEDRSHDQMFSYALMLEIWLRRFWR